LYGKADKTKGSKKQITDADEFEVHFPADIGVRVKAATIAAVFLINMMYFEDPE